MRSLEPQPPAGRTEAGPQELQTPRLAMRRLVADGAAFFLALVTDPAWIRFIGERKSDGVPLGLCGLIKRETLPDFDLGFAFLPQHRGQGYPAEAVQAIDSP